MGNEYLFQTLARKNIDTLRRHGVSKILTVCPHCYNTLKNEYPQTVAVILSKIKSEHAARVLSALPEDFALECVMRMLRMEPVQREIDVALQTHALERAREWRVKTPFGEPSDALVLGTLEGKRVAFLARHGRGHVILPSELNFRANIYGFKKLGVELHDVSAGRPA